MHAARRLETDQRVRLHGLRWRDYEALLEIRGDSAAVRISYLEGEVELMTPSDEHEDDKTRSARLIEAWSEEMEVDLDGVGSWTLKRKAAERGAEPDECYIVLAKHKARPSVPDFAIEVVRSSGGIDKLEICRLLGVTEVWFWEGGALRFHVLRGSRYVRATRSSLLPTLDPALIAKFMSRGTQPQAVREMRRALRGGRGRR